MPRLALAFVLLLLTASPALAQDAPPDVDSAAVLSAYLDGVQRRAAGDLDGAVDAMERAHALSPDDPDLTLELARAYEADHLYGAAAAAYAEALTIAPTRADLALAQARFHLDHAFRVREALAPAELAARLQPDDPETIRLLDRARSVARLSEA